ncbi:MAG: hypothetical protein R6X02_14315 [Enhygromyxa sp.]
MRTLGYSTLLLTASLLVAPACTKKNDSGEADKAGDDKAKVEDKKAEDQASGDSAAVDKPGGVAATAGGSAQLAASGLPASISLIPDQAEVVVGIGLGSIMSSPIYALAAGELAKDQEFQEVVSVFKDCGLDPAKFETVVVGFSQSEDFAAVLVADGIGEDKNAACVTKNVQKLAGDPQVADVVTQDGKKVIQFTDGRAFLVNDRTLALATTAWESSVADLIDGKGKPAASNSKKELFAKIDGSASLWALATVPTELAAMAPLLGVPAEFASLRNLAASVKLEDGASVDMLAGFDSEDTAKSVAATLQTMLGDASKDAPAELATMIQSTKIEAAGGDVKIVLSASMADIAKAATNAPI